MSRPDQAFAVAMGERGALVEDPDELDEDVDHTLRTLLGLRRAEWRLTDAKGSHPDQQPCPPWCIGAQGDYEHEIDPRSPNRALHVTDFRLAVCATLYPGDLTPGGGRGERPVVGAATIEPEIRQLGQREPSIRVHLRQGRGSETHRDEVLRLTADDARDLVTALSFLVELADHAAAERGRQ